MNNPDSIIRDLEIMAGAVNYRRWIYDQLSKYIGQRVVELGAGIGSFTEIFLDRELIVAVDNYWPCVEYLKSRFSKNKNIIPLKMDIANAETLSLSYYGPDTVVCINVLEHISNDTAALFNMFKILNKGGSLVLIAPAFQFLYGSIDRLVGHHRRYSKKELISKLIAAGFVIKDIFYMNSIAVFGWFLNNRILKRKEESPEQVLFYDRFVVPCLRSIERIIRPPFGLSLVAVGVKEDNSYVFRT